MTKSGRFALSRLPAVLNWFTASPPPNAIALASNQVSPPDLMRWGVWGNALCIAVMAAVATGGWA
ncbi:MAG: hypothetical protein CVU30_14570 [Betaproteobacteria bacterium HGW-Betaproteobacteria-3]|jgi:di/tricarboxylate transporter|nr:MAG: hypothetical protein CVU30_14570 [Betaproteobacteria bacterium HGW-Betaproteobacteria-3]